MRTIEVTIHDPGDLLALADAEGRVLFYRVMPDGTLKLTSESTHAEAIRRPGPNRMAEVTLDSTLDEWSKVFGLSVRPYNILAREGVKTWRQLVDLYEQHGSQRLT